MNAKNDDRHAWMRGTDSLGCFNTIQAGHGDVQDEYIGDLSGREFNGLAAVACFADNGKVLLALE
jgi:hypothetical protein